MKKLILGVLLLASVALAGIIDLETQFGTVDLTDCASGGSSATAITPGDYVMTVTDADSFVCILRDSSTTCASGGRKFPAGTVMLLRLDANISHVRCRSSTSTGDVQFTRATLQER